MLDKIRESSKYLAPFVKGEHSIGIILGTGLGELGKSIEIEHAIPYMAIPNFPVSTVQGHRGELLIGSFGGKKVIAMQGRFHYYEGYSMKEVTFPVRVMHALGVKTLFVSNAAGGVNTNYLVGDLMIIRDHINLFPEHPLRGKNIDELGPRFPGMAERRVSEIVAERNGFGQILIQIQRPRNRAGNLGHLECVRQAGPVMIALRSEKHLCFIFHPAKGFGVENPVPVSLVDGADVTLRFISVPSSGIPAVRRIRTQLLKFPFFKRFSQVQTKTTSFPVICL